MPRALRAQACVSVTPVGRLNREPQARVKDLAGGGIAAPPAALAQANAAGLLEANVSCYELSITTTFGRSTSSSTRPWLGGLFGDD